MKKAVLFDLDGTLINSLGDLCDSVNYMLNKQNLKNRTLDEVRSFIGNGVDILVKRAIGNREYNSEEVMADFREYYNDNLYNKTKPYEGITEALDILKDKGFKLAVVTNKSQYAAEKIVNHYFNDKFDIVVGSDITKRKKKPEPDGVNLALKEIGVTRQESIYIGDSEVDIETAKNAHMDFIGVRWGFRNEEIFNDKSNIAKIPSDIVTLCCNFL